MEEDYDENNVVVVVAAAAVWVDFSFKNPLVFTQTKSCYCVCTIKRISLLKLQTMVSTTT
jgi:hypothetical protein